MTDQAMTDWINEQRTKKANVVQAVEAVIKHLTDNGFISTRTGYVHKERGVKVTFEPAYDGIKLEAYRRLQSGGWGARQYYSNYEFIEKQYFERMLVVLDELRGVNLTDVTPKLSERYEPVVPQSTSFKVENGTVVRTGVFGNCTCNGLVVLDGLKLIDVTKSDPTKEEQIWFRVSGRSLAKDSGANVHLIFAVIDGEVRYYPVRQNRIIKLDDKGTMVNHAEVDSSDVEMMTAAAGIYSSKHMEK